MNPTRRFPRNFDTILLIVGAINSQMPCHLISDAHEWINEIPFVLFIEEACVLVDGERFLMSLCVLIRIFMSFCYK